MRRFVVPGERLAVGGELGLPSRMLGNYSIIFHRTGFSVG